MKLRHFSPNIINKVHGRRQGAGALLRAGLGGKPCGFWVSDEQRGAYGWRAWCKSENFRSYAMRYEHEVVLSEKARILYLRTPEDLQAFTAKYKAESEINARMREIRLSGPPSVYEIDWRRVAKKYHGIIITPYQWSERLGNLAWYYGWDCASGCIWNARAIESITMIRERRAPKKPTAWQIKRKHKRDIQRMREATEVLKELNTIKPREAMSYGRKIPTSKI